ncbi:MAG: hypothetical protein JW969_11635 [Spirochaetales bacterium]|nr:hypothetical protein [Spirochaetales bacterium]
MPARQILKKNNDWFKYFNTTPVIIDGKSFELNKSDLESQYTDLNYWHGEGDPSSWLAVSIFNSAARKYPGIGEKIHLKIAAHALNISTRKLISSIKWHEQYMRWHDGDPDYSILEK